MKRTLELLLAIGLVLPGSVFAQQDPVEKLGEVLPEDRAEQVMAIVQNALSQGLPGLAIAERALEGAAKGRSGEEVVAAAQELAGQLAAAQGAIESAGRTPDASEIESGANAMAVGVDGATISELATTTPSGRSLAVPMAVIASLCDRGLPSDDALAAVKARLENHAADLELLDMPSAAGYMLAQGMKPSDVGLVLASERAGLHFPAGLPIAAPGAPSGVPSGAGEIGVPTPPTPPKPPVGGNGG